MSTEAIDYEKSQDFILSQRIRALKKSAEADNFFSEGMDKLGGVSMAGMWFSETPNGLISEMPKEFLDLLEKAEEMAGSN